MAIEILENPSIINNLRMREAHATSFILEYAGIIPLAIQCLQKVISLNPHPDRAPNNAYRLKQLQARLAESQTNPDTKQPAAQPLTIPQTQPPETPTDQPPAPDSPSATAAQPPTIPQTQPPEASTSQPPASDSSSATLAQPPAPPANQPPASKSPEKKPDLCRELLTWIQRLETTSKGCTKENGFLIISDAQRIAELSGELERMLTDGNAEQLYTDHLSVTGTDNLRGMIGTNLLQGIRAGKVKIRLFDQITTALESLLPDT